VEDSNRPRRVFYVRKNTGDADTRIAEREICFITGREKKMRCRIRVREKNIFEFK